MKRFAVLALAAFAIVSTFGTFAAAEQVLMIVKENSEDLELMLTKEVGVMTEGLEKAGFEVVVATASGKPMTAGTARLQPDLKLIDVKAKDYVGFIIPCMATGLGEPAPEVPQAVAIIKEAVAAGKPLAAQVSSVLILAEAGALKGNKYAFLSEERVKEQSVLEGAVFSGNGVVQDGKIITSGICPYAARSGGLEDGTPELTKAMITALSGDK